VDLLNLFTVQTKLVADMDPSLVAVDFHTTLNVSVMTGLVADPVKSAVITVAVMQN